VTDWVWRWSKGAVKWGIEEKMFVIKNDRIYTKSYLNCRKKNGKNELEWIDATKAYTTLSYLDNKYSNDNGKKELDKIFDDGSTLFKNPKPTSLITSLIKMVCQNKEAIILDFFAGSGTTGHAVLDLNAEDKGERKFILCTSNEVTSTTPNGVVMDVTSKRLKRVMTGSCYGNGDFGLARKGIKPLGGALDVYEITHVANFESTEGNSVFEVIDETLYGINKFAKVKDKVTWVCENFEGTQKVCESDLDWKDRIGGDK
jgi:adenine-specific DNA-methyltransferase